MLLAMLFCMAAGAASQTTPQQIQKLYDAGHWRQIVRAVPATPGEPADLALYRGLALAQLGRLPEAEKQFRALAALHPQDARFPREIAGIAYRERRFSVAKKQLLRALALDPSDNYTNNFLASIYFLQGNLDAALKYWNRIGKPKLNDLTDNVGPGLDPLILDRAFAFSRGSQWRLDRFLTTQATLASLDLFPRMRFDLRPRSDGLFNLGFDTALRDRGTSPTPVNIASFLRGLPYQAVDPEFYNLDHKGLNWLSFVRWDAEKRWLSSEVSAPLPQDPRERFRLYFNGRNENWNIARTLLPATPAPAAMNMERAVVGAAIQSIVSWRWQWGLGVEYSYRRFRTLTGIPTQAAPFFTGASAIALRPRLQYALLRSPEHRFTLDTSDSAEFGNFYSSPLGRYARIDGSLAANWLPQASGDDYQTQTMLRAGRTFGQVPFDDLYMLGFDRDNDLWMRGHNGLVDGKKGNAPLGRNYVLSNSEIDKIVYHDAFVTLKLGPFLDTGDIYDPSGYFGSPKWLTDTGVQASVGLLGSFAFVLGYGKDLRSGNNTFYTTVTR